MGRYLLGVAHLTVDPPDKEAARTHLETARDLVADRREKGASSTAPVHSNRQGHGEVQVCTTSLP